MSKKIRAFIGYLKVLVNGETLGGGFYRFFFGRKARTVV